MILSRYNIAGLLFASSLMSRAAFGQGLSPKAAIDRLEQLPGKSYSRPDSLALRNANGSWLNLGGELRRDLLADLSSYDIRSSAVRWQLHSTLFKIGLLTGDFVAALAHIDSMVAAEPRKAGRAYSGLIPRAVVAASRAGQQQAHAVFLSTLRDAIGRQPFADLKSSLQNDLAYFQMDGNDTARVVVAAEQQFRRLRPSVSLADAQRLVDAWYSMQEIAFRSEIVGVYASVLRAHPFETRDIWKRRDVSLDSTDRLTPVTVAIWDRGIDFSLFPGRLFVNDREIPDNGIDDDANGFFDDVHGIGFDCQARAASAALPPSPLTEPQTDSAVQWMVGQIDLRNGTASAAATWLTRLFRESSPEAIRSLRRNINSYFVWYAHGTQIADIATRGNPAIRLLPIVASLANETNDSSFASVARARRVALAYQQSVDYMKQHGARVANLSWGFTVQDFDRELRKVMQGASDSARSQRARELFDIYGTGITKAIASAPDILFVVTAGNQALDTRLVQRFPANLDLPNVLTAGAVDEMGEETSFTSFGKVDVYANGQDRAVLLPGGRRAYDTGVSLAAPEIVNLAAKLWALSPKASVDDVRRAIIDGSDYVTAEDGRTLRVLNPRKSLELGRRL